MSEVSIGLECLRAFKGRIVKPKILRTIFRDQSWIMLICGGKRPNPEYLIPETRILVMVYMRPFRISQNSTIVRSIDSPGEIWKTGECKWFQMTSLQDSTHILTGSVGFCGYELNLTNTTVIRGKSFVLNKMEFQFPR